jgi:hypothetical protein
MSADSTVLIPSQQRSVEFYGDTILGLVVAGDDENELFVPIRPICEFLGLSWAGQFERIKRDEVLAAEIRDVRVTRTPQEGGSQDMLCLPLEYLPGWLFGVSTSRVKPELRDRIIRYRRECYRALWNAFKHDILPSTEFIARPVDHSGASIAYEIATAVQHLARQQMEMEQHLDGRIDRMGQWANTMTDRVAETEARLSTLEMQVSPGAVINEAQAAEIALAVKNVGHALATRGIKPGYSQVYGELYRRYGISSYKNLARGQFDEVIEWLRAWYTEMTAPGAE